MNRLAGQVPPSLAHRAANRVERLLGSRLVRFVMVGGLNTAFSYAVFAALQFTLGRYVHYLVVLLVSTIVSVVEAYVTQRWLVWRVQGRWWGELARFSVVYLVVFAVNVVLLPLLHELAGFPVLVAQAMILAVNAIGTFVVHRAFTFRR